MNNTQTTTNPPVDDDLQKAIDNITNTTNIDPVFADPVATPGTVTDENGNDLSDDAVGPLPPVPEPIAPLSAMDDMPELVVPEEDEEPTETAPATAPAAAAPAPATSIAVEEVAIEEPKIEEPKVEEPVAPEPVSTESVDTSDLSMTEIKKSALRDLTPLLDHISMTSPQKFNLYRNIFENLKDYTILGRAYGAAKGINDETERAEALLYLIETIDNM